MDHTMLMQEQWEGWGSDSQEQVAALAKALVAQEGITDYSTLRGGGALQPQSLEATLAMLTFGMSSIKFWKNIGIQKAYSTLEEYTRNEGYGTEAATGAFNTQLENPEGDDAELSRGTLRVKFMRQLWKVGDVLGHVRTVTNAEAIQVQAAMMRQLRALEYSLFFANSAWVPQAFDGLLPTIVALGSTDHLIDMRGAALSETILRQGAEVIKVNHGEATKMYNSTGVQTSIDALLSTAAGGQRVIQNQLGTGNLSLGWRVNEMRTSFGDFNFIPDIFLSRESQGVPTVKNAAGVIVEGATSAKAPAVPTLVVTPTGAGAAGSLWAGAGVRVAGAYGFRVSAINRFGKSVACANVIATSVAAQGLSITITEGGGSFPATAYEIYSTLAAGTVLHRYMTTVPVTGAADTAMDLNLDIPGTSIAFLVDDTSVGDHRTFAFKQLAPIHRVEYARVAPYRWGVVRLYGAPAWYAPRRLVAFKNIGVGAGYRNINLDL